jgi:hypothetical protein
VHWFRTLATLLLACLCLPVIDIASAQTAGGDASIEIVPSTGGVSQNPISIDAKGVYAAVVAGNGAELWDLRKGRLVRKFADTQIGIAVTAAISADGSRIAAGGYGTEVLVWDVRTGRAISRHASQLASVQALVLSRDGRRLAFGGSSKFNGPRELVLADVDTGQFLKTVDGDGVHSMSLSTSQDLVAVGYVSGKTRVIDLSGRVIKEWTAHPTKNGPATSTLRWVNMVRLAVSRDGRQLASGGDDGAVKIWDVSTGRLLRAFAGHDGVAVQGVAWSPDGHALATIDERRLQIWDTRSGTLVRSGSFAPSVVGYGLASVAYAPDGTFLLVNGLARVHAGTLEFQGHIGARLYGTVVPIHGVAGGEVLIAGGPELSLYWLDLATGTTRKLVSEPEIKSHRGLVATRLGTHIAGYGVDKTGRGEDNLFFKDLTAKVGVKILASKLQANDLRADLQLAISPDGRERLCVPGRSPEPAVSPKLIAAAIG